MDLQTFLKDVSHLKNEMEVKRNEPMSAHTTFQIGGPAQVFVQPRTERALLGALCAAAKAGGGPIVIGRGSNLLVRDEGVSGVVICTCGLNGVHVEENRIIAGAGATLSQVAQAAFHAGLTGAEFAAGIPGTLGGGVYMNAGAYDGQMADLVAASIYADPEGKLHRLEGAAQGFGYRSSIYRGHPDWTVVSAELELKPGDPAAIGNKMADFAQRRREKQPLNYPSAGSTFKRPAGYFAGQLIEQAGLKGLRIGGAQVSEKHAGFLVNLGGATCADMLSLIEAVKQRVAAQSGVKLECEIRLIG